MFHLAKRVDGRVLLANLFLLFWLSLVPIAFVMVWASVVIYVAVALVWLIPDPRVEEVLPDA